ncbi:MAG: ABC transporter permease [Dehalococcoidia bacterium]|nr:ABC transporter permease [Chloroflexota bacterium]MXY43682.1 ABC transporter permease [Dehalococcoidia bacterium]MYB48641.1 ABC transporter permease [Dehalococcoidia bacterium]
MIAFIVRRFLLGVFALWVISIIAFFVVTLPPGDFVDDYIANLVGEAGQGTPAADALEKQLRAEYGLDAPVWFQYLKWMSKVVRGDLSFSVEFNRPVREVIWDKLPLTIIVAGTTILFTWTMAIPLGIYAAVRHRTIEDYSLTFIGFIGLAIPDFLLALAFLWIGWFYFDLSIGGLFTREYITAPWSGGKVVDMLAHLWIPVIVLGTAGTASLLRIMRANLLDELRKPYVVTARSKGLKEWRVIIKYPVRVALNPIISTVGYLLPALISGSIIVSVILALPLIGPLLLRALLAEDLFMASGILLVLGALTIIGTFVSDILLVFVDPRIRMEDR